MSPGVGKAARCRVELERSGARSGVHSSSSRSPSPPVLFRPALLRWWLAEVERGLGSLWQLLYPGSHSGVGRSSWSPEFKSRSTALVQPTPAIAGRSWRCLGLGGKLEEVRGSWGYGRTGAAPGSTLPFPVTLHNQERRPSTVFLYCRAPRVAELGLGSPNARG